MKQITDNPELYQQLVELYGKERADKMIADKVQKSQAIRDAGVAYKSHRPTPTLAELTAKSKALSARIRQQKDVQEAAEADALIDLMTLADNLDLNQAAIIELVRQYNMAQVMSILRTLSTVKSTGKGFKSVFFGVTTDSPDISDVQMMLKQTSGFDPFFT